MLLSLSVDGEMWVPFCVSAFKVGTQQANRIFLYKGTRGGIEKTKSHIPILTQQKCMVQTRKAH